MIKHFFKKKMLTVKTMVVGSEFSKCLFMKIYGLVKCKDCDPGPTSSHLDVSGLGLHDLQDVLMWV